MLKVSLGCIALGAVLGLLLKSSAVGLILAGLASVIAVPISLYVSWLGIQEKTQTSLALSLVVLVTSIGVTGLLWALAAYQGFQGLR